MEKLKTVFEVIEGQKAKDRILKPVPVGSATLYEGNNYYVVRISSKPFKNFFVVKNQDGTNTYSIYARRWRTADQIFFRDPVGAGHLSGELKEFLELKFTFLNQSLFMSLYPKPNKGGFIDEN
jgi:hypothetical protein